MFVCCPKCGEKLSLDKLLLNDDVATQLIYECLEKNHYYDVLGYFLESIWEGQYYAPGLVKAAEAYEKGGKIKKALELYKKCTERCRPDRIDVYDENTGGYVSAIHYPELNRELIERAEKLVKYCEQKVSELKQRIKKTKN